MRNSYEASSLELLESEEYDKYRKNGFSENTYTKTNSVPKTTKVPSYEIPQKKVYTYSPPIPNAEKVETNVSKTPDVSSVELLESGNYSQKEIFGGEQKKNNTASKTYAESQVKSSPEISSLEYTEDYLPKQIKLPFESLIDNEKDEHIRKRLLPVLQTFDAAKYSPDFATKSEERYRTNKAYKKWIDESENILEDYARNHPDIDFSAAIDRIRHINGTWTLHELLKMGEEEKLTKSGESSKVEEKSKKDKILDTASNVLAAASLIPGLDTFTNLASIPVDIARGDWVSAGLDAVGIIPFVGEVADVTKTARLANKAVDALKIADKATDAVKITDKISDSLRMVDKVDDVRTIDVARNVTRGKNSSVGLVSKTPETNRLNIQFFAEKDLEKQSINSLKKGISSFENQIGQHKNKIANPEKFVSGWESYSKEHKQGLLKHWNKEIKNFEESINSRLNEINKRGGNIE